MYIVETSSIARAGSTWAVEANTDHVGALHEAPSQKTSGFHYRKRGCLRMIEMWELLLIVDFEFWRT